MIRKYIPKNIQELADWYMRYVSPIGLVAGVVADNLILLRRVDVWTSNALLSFHLLTAATCILLINLIESGRLRQQWAINSLPLLPVVAQFAFGGLFSGFVSLYSRSAQYAVSWIFVVALAALLIGNERFVRFYRRFTFQIGIYFGVLFSFLIFFLPVIFHRIGPWMFVLAGGVSLGVITLFLSILYALVPEIVRREKMRVARTIAIIYIVFNALYFTDAIPPLPLAIKDAGVYHNITRVDDTYVLSYEPVPWYEAYLRYNTTYHKAPNEAVYVWTAVFAPSGLSTTIYHEWQRRDAASRKWVTTNTFSYPIVGGRDGGFRGYSIKRGVSAGEWRVNVITAYGQIIGRVTFTVVDSTTTPALSRTSQ